MTFTCFPGPKIDVEMNVRVTRCLYIWFCLVAVEQCRQLLLMNNTKIMENKLKESEKDLVWPACFGDFDGLNWEHWLCNVRFRLGLLWAGTKCYTVMILIKTLLIIQEKYRGNRETSLRLLTKNAQCLWWTLPYHVIVLCANTQGRRKTW